MIIGFVQVQDGAVTTHRDSFILSGVSVVSVRRPYLAGAILLGCGLAGFALAFGDLLYPHECLVLATFVFSLLFLGLQIGQLTLLSRDLKGTELSSAVWGTPSALQKIRAEIVRERQLSSGEKHHATS